MKGVSMNCYLEMFAFIIDGELVVVNHKYGVPSESLWSAPEDITFDWECRDWNKGHGSCSDCGEGNCVKI
jgi:hypothetical protein